LKISFENKILRNICEDYEFAIERYGVDLALILFKRLSDIEVAKDFSDIGFGNTIIDENKTDKIFITYYFNKDETQFLKFEIPENVKLFEDFQLRQIITRIKLINIQL